MASHIRFTKLRKKKDSSKRRKPKAKEVACDIQQHPSRSLRQFRFYSQVEVKIYYRRKQSYAIFGGSRPHHWFFNCEKLLRQSGFLSIKHSYSGCCEMHLWFWSVFWIILPWLDILLWVASWDNSSGLCIWWAWALVQYSCEAPLIWQIWRWLI